MRQWQPETGLRGADRDAMPWTSLAPDGAAVPGDATMDGGTGYRVRGPSGCPPYPGLRRPAGRACSPFYPRFLSRRAARVALAALLLAGAAGIAAPASADVLVSNVGQSQSSPGGTSRCRATRFTTGANASGYGLDSVEVRFGNAPSGVTVKVGSSRDSASVATLTNPGSFSSGNNTFTAPSGTTLDASTTYWVTVSTSAGGIALTGSNSEDSAGESDWSIRNGSDVDSGCNGGWSSLSPSTLMLRVNGTVTAYTGPGLVFSETSLNLYEDETAEYTVKLDAEPSADVTVAIASGDTGAATVSPASLTFTSTTWSTAQTVTVTGVQDGDTNDEALAITHRIGAAQVGEVGVSVLDDDILRLVLRIGDFEFLTGGRVVVQEGDTGPYAAALDREPSTDVTVNIASSDTNAATVSPASLTFKTTNWSDTQGVTVTGVQDTDARHERVTMTHSATGMRTHTLTVLVVDDEADPPPRATNLRATQWQPFSALSPTLHATLEWDLPASRPPGETLEKVIVEWYESTEMVWLTAHESTKAISSWVYPGEGGGFALESGGKARVVLEYSSGARAVSAELALEAPAAATNLSVDGTATLTKIPLTWDLPTQPPGVTVSAVVVLLSTDDGDSYEDVGRLAADATSFTVTGLTAETNYDIRVALETSRGRVLTPNLDTYTLGNEPPEGDLDISGGVSFSGGLVAFVGDTLTAVTSGITDANGLTSPNWRFQWYRKDTNLTSLVETLVTLSGATRRTYRVAAADTSNASFDRLVFVRATYTDDEGFTHTVSSTPDVHIYKLASDATVTATEDADYTFAASDFNFSPVPGQTDALEKVKIVSVETAGDLELDDTDVTAGTELTKANLDNDKLVFKLPADANGAPYATFTFKVSGTIVGAATFGATHTMTINVDSKPDVTGVAVTSRPRSGTTDPKKYGKGGKIRITATFDEAVTVTGDPHVDVAVGTNTRTAAYKRGSGTAHLLFEYVVVEMDTDTDGISVAANALKLDSNDKIRNANDKDADITHAALVTQSGHTVDGSLEAPDNEPPTSADGAVTVDSNGTYTFAAADFAFMDEDAGDTFDGVQISTLETAGDLELDGTDVTAGQTVSKSDIEAGKLAFSPAPDRHGADYATFGFKVSDGTDNSDDAYTMTIHVRNVDVAVPGTPRARSAAVEGKALTLVFSEPVDASVVPPADRFKPRVNGQTRAVSAVAVAAGRVTLTLVEATIAGDTVTLSYDRPRLTRLDRYQGKKVSPLRDLTGVEVESFTNLAVTNNSAACPGTASQGTSFWSGCVTIGSHGSFMVGYVDGRFGKLSETSFTRSSVRYELDGIVEQYPIGPHPRAFHVSFAGDPRPAAKNWTLLFGDSPVLHFKDAEYREKDRSYKWTISTSRLGFERAGDKVSVHLIPGSVDAPPKLSGAPVVDGATLELAFDENLNTGSVPAKAAFDVEVGGSDRALASANPVAVSGRTVTLTLSSAAGWREKVTVSYAKPASNPLEDGAGNDVTDFEATVVNETPNPRERGLVFAPARVTVPEGGSATYTVTLDRAPEAGAPVYVKAKEMKASYRASDKLKISPVGFLLDTTNWNTGKEFTVSALRDGDGHDNGATLMHGGVRVRGGFTDNSSGSAHLEVTITDVNAPPRAANPIPDQALVADRTFSYTFPEDTFHDADDDPLSYHASRSFAAWPGWLAFDGPTRTFSGTPRRADTGFYQIYVRADDGVAHRAPNTQDLFYFRVYESLEARLEGRRLRPARGGGPSGSLLRSWSRSAEGASGGCRVEVWVRFVAPDGTTVEVAELTAADFTVENGRLGTPARDGEGWSVEMSADPGFTGLMRVRLLARELAEVPEPDGEDGEPRVSEADSQTWAGSEQVFRVASDSECGPVARTALAGLALEGMTLEPAFDSDTYRYRVTVPNFVTNATLRARAVYEAASVSISLEDDDENVTGHQVALSDAFQVRVTVTAGEETRSYIIEGSPPEVAALTGFVLVNASTDADLGAVSDGGTVSVSANGIYGIRAGVAASADVGSVVLSLAGPGTDDLHEQTENIAPYSLWGDRQGAEHGRALAAGSYTLTATAYAESGGTGDELGTLTAAFTVEVEAAPVTPPPAAVLTGFVLLDASDQSTVAALANGAEIDLDSRSGGSFAIRATVAPNATVGSVALSLSGAKAVSRTENLAPYSLYGDDMQGTLYGGTLPAGTYTLSATAYAERRASGSTLGTLSVSFEVLAPALLSVADARAEEGTDATLDFAVTLDRSSTGTVTVAYATADGTATAGSDYTATSGTLTFAAGETRKAVSVAVADDDHDEGSETLTLRLTNPSGATIADGEATGTITNSDALPRAWLARFGRTVTGQVLETVETRLAAPRASGVEASLAGQALPSWGGAAAAANPGLGTGAGGHAASAKGEEQAPAARASTTWWLTPAGADGRGTARFGGQGAGLEPRWRALTGRELIAGTSFALTGGGRGGFASFWGRGSMAGFDGREGGVTVDGEVTTGLIGADWASARWTAGLAMGHSTGTGGYRKGGECGENEDDRCAGGVEAALTGVYPYAGWDLTERLSVWAAAGHGAGEVTLEPDRAATLSADLTMSMGAAGLRGEVLRPEHGVGLALAVKGDARFTRTSSDAVSGAGGKLEASDADVWLARAGIEGSRRFAFGGGGRGASVTPSFELGVRLDGGDAETGLGADLGGGVAFADPRHGLTFESRARALVAHESSGFREWGASVSAGWDPRPDTDRGFSLSLIQSWGASPSGGMDALLSRETLAGLAANGDADGFEASGRLEAEAGYGLSVFGGGFTGTPNLRFGLSEGAREYRIGWRLTAARRKALDFELSLDATRKEPVNDDAEPESGVMVRGALRW